MRDRGRLAVSRLFHCSSEVTWGHKQLRLDCCHYRGERPCAAGIQGFCPQQCPHYQTQGKRILIIKLGALGDVIRTAALLPGLKERWPCSHITWVSRPSGVRALANHPLVDRRLVFDAETLCHLDREHFDLCISLDKEPGPAALVMRVQAREKCGIGLSPYGTVYPLNDACLEYFELGINDNLKFRTNEKSYPQLIYELCGLPYRGQRYRLYPGVSERTHAAKRWQSLGVNEDDVVVGLNTGAGRVFANKNWPAEKFVTLARRLRAKHPWRIALLGGPDEIEVNARIAAACPGVLDTGGDHTELEFAALVARCHAVVTGDTMALHVAVAVGVPCIALFGPTCAAEIDLFGRGEKIVSRVPCAPCYRRHCDRSPNCMDEIDVERVTEALERWVAPVSVDTTGLRSLSLPVVGVNS